MVGKKTCPPRHGAKRQRDRGLPCGQREREQPTHPGPLGVPATLTGFFDEGVVMANNDPIRGREDVKLDHIHAKPDRLQERWHRVAVYMPALCFSLGVRGHVRLGYYRLRTGLRTAFRRTKRVPS